MRMRRQIAHMLFESRYDGTALSELINSGEDTISLEHDYSIDARRGKAIEISGDIVIDGNCKRIRGSSEAMLFNVTGNVVLKNIIFEEGCGIENSGDLIIEDCVFGKNNLMIRNSGKLIITESEISKNSSCIIENEGECEFGCCKIVGNSSESLIANEGKMVIFECLIDENSCKGKAVSNNGDLLIDSCNINANDSDTLISNAGKLKMHSCQMNYNRCMLADNAKGEIEIVKSEILRNECPDILISNGHFLYVRDMPISENLSKELISNNGKMTLSKVRLESNAIQRSVITNDRTATIEHSIFKGNLKAGENPYNILNKGDLTLTKVKIEEGYETIRNERMAKSEDVQR